MHSSASQKNPGYHSYVAVKSTLPITYVSLGVDSSLVKSADKKAAQSKPDCSLMTDIWAEDPHKLCPDTSLMETVR